MLSPIMTDLAEVGTMISAFSRDLHLRLVCTGVPWCVVWGGGGSPPTEQYSTVQ